MHQIKRWYLMLTGKSVWHVNQDIGKHFAKDEVAGYYNNMKEKVTKMPELLDSDRLPQLNVEGGEYVYFPVAIFQYGLGAWDLYIETKEQVYRTKFFQCVDWAIANQDAEGRWNNFSHYCPKTPYSAMAQGEATSLLIRAYIHTGDAKYLQAAQKALDYMLISIENGGTTKYEGGEAYLMEYTFKGMVMNGSIFAWWGLYDYVLATGDTGKYRMAKDETLESLIKVLPQFKGSYWSLYSLDGLIASPFYHNLHIAQMQAMYELTNREVFNEYAVRWKKQQTNVFCKGLAFIKKACQKLLE